MIVQIGENVNGANLYHNIEGFVDSYVNLLNKFENSTKIITLPFWQSELRNEAISSVAMQANAIICDLSHIGCDDTNKAVQIHIWFFLLDLSVLHRSNPEQVCAFIVFHLYNTTMELTIDEEPESIHNRHRCVESPRQNYHRLSTQDAEYVSCHFHYQNIEVKMV